LSKSKNIIIETQNLIINCRILLIKKTCYFLALFLGGCSDIWGTRFAAFAGGSSTAFLAEALLVLREVFC
jgi:hypothetical protein